MMLGGFTGPPESRLFMPRFHSESWLGGFLVSPSFQSRLEVQVVNKWTSIAYGVLPQQGPTVVATGPCPGTGREQPERDSLHLQCPASFPTRPHSTLFLWDSPSHSPACLPHVHLHHHPQPLLAPSCSVCTADAIHVHARTCTCALETRCFPCKSCLRDAHPSLLSAGLCKDPELTFSSGHSPQRIGSGGARIAASVVLEAWLSHIWWTLTSTHSVFPVPRNTGKRSSGAIP